MSKLFQFLKRDFHIEIAYKMKLFSDLFYVAFLVVVYYFIAKLVGNRAAAHLARYDCDYFSFVMVGVTLGNILQAGLQSYTESMRRCMVEGCLEAMFATPTPPYVLIIYSSSWHFVYAFFKAGLQYLVAYLAFGFTLERMNLVSTAIVLSLSLAMFNSIGVISASLLIIVKRGDSIK